MPDASDTPQGGETPLQKFGPTEIARDWQRRQGTEGPSRAYASQCVKRGCPTHDLDAAWQWRIANSHYGEPGYRCKGAKNPSLASAAEIVEPKKPEKGTIPGGGELPSHPENTLPRPADPHLASLWHSLDAAIRIEWLAGQNAFTVPSEQMIRAYNNARNGRYEAEKAYHDALERHRILVSMSEAMALGRRGYDILLPALHALGAKVAPDCARSEPAAIKAAIDREVSVILRRAEGAFEEVPRAA